MEIVRDKDELKKKIDIVEYIGRYVNLSKGSGGTYVGLSPVKAEKTPSFYVIPSKGIWKDYAGGTSEGKTGGDIFAFYRYLNPGATFGEAIREVARENGYAYMQTQAQQEKYAKQSRLEKLMADYQEILQGNLEKSPQTRQALNERGVSDESIKTHGIGLSTLGDLNTLRRKGYTDTDFEKLRIINASKYPMYGTRITIPVTDARGRVISYSARSTRPKGEEMKYLNGADTELYSRRKEIYMPMPSRKREGLLMLTEGCFDAIAVSDVGYKSAAFLGTEAAPEQITRIAKEEVNVVMMYDGDEAGVNKTRKTAFALLGEGCNVKVAMLPEEHDPASWLASGGSITELAKSGGIIDIFDWNIKDLSLDSLEGRRMAARRTAELLSACDATARDWYVKRFAELLGMDDARGVFPKVFGEANVKVDETFLAPARREKEELRYEGTDEASRLEAELFRTAIRRDALGNIMDALHEKFFIELAGKMEWNRKQGISVFSGLTGPEREFLADQRGYESPKPIQELVKEHRVAVVRKELEIHRKAVARLEKELARLEPEKSESRGKSR